VSGNTLLSQLFFGVGINESTARSPFKQFIVIVAYGHGQGIARRDRKLECEFFPFKPRSRAIIREASEIIRRKLNLANL
jgi:hypothetical protein